MKNPLPRSQDPAHNWQAADGGKRDCSKHAGVQDPEPLRWNFTRIIVGHDSTYGAIPKPDVLISSLHRFEREQMQPLVNALETALLELEANKTAMQGPEWAAQRTATGGALAVVARALAYAKQIPA